MHMAGGRFHRRIPLNQELLHRIKSCRQKHSTVDDIVDHLRSSYRDYSRLPKSSLKLNVQQGLDSLDNSQRKVIKTSKSTPSASTPSKTKRQVVNLEEEEDGDGYRGRESSNRKRCKRIDEREKKLQSLEDMHVRRIHLSDQDDSSSSSSSRSSCSSDSDDSDGGAVSTSEDAIYGEKVEPEFDLMKSMLRTSYTNANKGMSNNVEKNVELDVAMKNKVAKKIDGSKGKLRNELKDGHEPGLINGGEITEGKEEGPRFKDLGGMKEVLEELKMEVIIPLYHPHLPRWLGVRPMAGILLHGPPGCGKTKLAHAIANETGVPFYKISATEVVSGVSGASEENIRELFSKAYRTAPSIVFIDEIDAIASKRENLQREMEKRIVTQLMTCMDQSHRLVKSADGSSKTDSSDVIPGYVLVIGATNRPDAVDPALRRPGRFDREIVLGVPDENARAEILSVLTSNLRLEGSFDLLKIARATPGFVGADLTALANMAGNLAMKRIIDQRKCELSSDLVETLDTENSEDWWRRPWLEAEMTKLAITMTDFEEAVKMVQPSSRREGFSAIPNVKWEDVGGLEKLRKEFDRYIVRRVKYPEDYEGFGVDLETGFLLYGPPGCGKTLIAKAVANEAGVNFIHIKGPELLNKYVGESELAVRTLFSRARTCSPCILFFDEVDALTTKRGKEGGWVVERLLNQLLIELDGAEQRRGVFVIGATNRPEVMDRAVLRPGRFGKLLYVPLPGPVERGLILKALARKKPIDASVDLLAIGQMDGCENLSGADLSALMNEAAMAALEDKLTTVESSLDSASCTIKMTHFERGLDKISPSVSKMQKNFYDNLSGRLKAA